MDAQADPVETGSGARARQRVAIIGTGLAGLTTAYLLENDAQKRYQVTLLDQSPKVSFDSSSLTIENGRTGLFERIDVPMRASAGGYYAELAKLYKWLDIKLHPVKFLFKFSDITARSQNASGHVDSKGGKEGLAVSYHQSDYFVHASNLHQIPPRPRSRSQLSHLLELGYLLIWYCWFSVACFLIVPAPAESLGDYASRIHLPSRFITHYILPLMSSVATCSHQQMLNFPASDLVNYKRLSLARQHYAVCGGVSQVQEKLVKNLEDVRLGKSVYSIEPQEKKVLVKWKSSAGGSMDEELFDQVVMAVSPNIVSEIFEPLSARLKGIPTVMAESSVISPKSERCKVIEATEKLAGKAGCMHHQGDTPPAQSITFRSEYADGDRGSTEASHTMPSGVIVRTLPREGDREGEVVLQSTKFVRTLRTVQSKKVVEEVMGYQAQRRGDWTNGDNNVWLVGSWCWDGMVLLEGCVVSAIRVAERLDVKVPWEESALQKGHNS